MRFGNGDCVLVVDVWVHRVDEDASGLTFEEWDPSSDTETSESPVAIPQTDSRHGYPPGGSGDFEELQILPEVFLFGPFSLPRFRMVFYSKSSGGISLPRFIRISMLDLSTGPVLHVSVVLLRCE